MISRYGKLTTLVDLCENNSGTGGFLSQAASNAELVFSFIEYEQAA